MMYDGFSGFGFLIWFVIYVIALGVPVVQILKRTGYSPLWVLLAFIPLVNLIFLWVFAFSRWPMDGEKAQG